MGFRTARSPMFVRRYRLDSGIIDEFAAFLHRESALVSSVCSCIATGTTSTTTVTATAMAVSTVKTTTTVINATVTPGKFLYGVDNDTMADTSHRTAATTLGVSVTTTISIYDIPTTSTVCYDPGRCHCHPLTLATVHHDSQRHQHHHPHHRRRHF